MKHAALVLIFLAALVSACSHLPGSRGKGNAIARVHNQYLYPTDIEGLVPPGTSQKDSLEIINTYIQNWVRQNLLIRQAENNLDASGTNFQREVEQYRNSLVIFQYESELVKQKLDTAVSMAEITEYYNKNRENFLLHENIVRSDYIISDKDSPQISSLRRLFQTTSGKDFRKLASLCEQHATGYSLGDTTWYALSDLAKKVPINPANPDALPINRIIEFQDDDFRYLLKITDFKSKESISPLVFETNNIRAIILNKRKTELLKKMEEDLMQQAIRNNYFEVYNQTGE